MALIDKETIRAEIERRKNAAKYYDMSGGDAPIYDDLLAFLDTLPEQHASDDLEKEIKRWIHAQRNNGRKLFGWIDMVELAARHFYELGCTRTAVMYDDIEYERQRAEEAEVAKGMEEEIEIEAERFVKTLPWRTNTPPMPDEYIDWSTFKTIARHFAEWGAEHSKK